jgi:hypothetical protein
MKEVYEGLSPDMQRLVRIQLQPTYKNFQLTWILTGGTDKNLSLRDAIGKKGRRGR